jgi:hypothetical protein
MVSASLPLPFLRQGHASGHLPLFLNANKCGLDRIQYLIMYDSFCQLFLVRHSSSDKKECQMTVGRITGPHSTPLTTLRNFGSLSLLFDMQRPSIATRTESESCYGIFTSQTFNEQS